MGGTKRHLISVKHLTFSWNTMRVTMKEKMKAETSHGNSTSFNNTLHPTFESFFCFFLLHRRQSGGVSTLIGTKKNRFKTLNPRFLSRKKLPWQKCLKWMLGGGKNFRHTDPGIKCRVPSLRIKWTTNPQDNPISQQYIPRAWMAAYGGQRGAS
jgi:hypothetical protein